MTTAPPLPAVIASLVTGPTKASRQLSGGLVLAYTPGDATTAVSQQAQFELEQAAKDREMERELKRRAQADKTAVQMARIEAKAKQPQPISQNGSQASQKITAADSRHYECICGKVFQGSRSYNAHRRHCEIPASEPVRIFTNGVAK